MSIIWMPLSRMLATTAYVLPPTSAIATLLAPASTEKSSSPSAAVPAGDGLVGSDMSIIWMPLSLALATTAYVLPPTSAIATLLAPASTVKPPSPSVAVPAGDGLVGSDISIIWMPLSLALATTAYVLPPTSAIATLLAPASTVKPPSPSAAVPAGDGLVGSDISIIWMPLPSPTTTAYVLPPTSAIATLSAYLSSVKPPSPSIAVPAGDGLVGSLMSTT